jgi:N-acetylmuramoyl-L-alanine amidase
VLVMPWRDVAERHAARSRALAEAVLSAVELRDLGPARLREFLPYSLIGVDAPGLMLECGTLTSPADLERLTAPGGLQGLAAVLADGIVAYQRSE